METNSRVRTNMEKPGKMVVFQKKTQGNSGNFFCSASAKKFCIKFEAVLMYHSKSVCMVCLEILIVAFVI